MNRRAVFFVVAAILFSALTGCVQQKSNGSTNTFTYELWVLLGAVLGGIATAPVGRYLSFRTDRLGSILMIFGPLAALIFSPTLFLERAVVDDSTFSVRTGMWGSTSVSVKFDDLKHVRYAFVEVKDHRRRKSTNHFLFCKQKNDSTVQIPINTRVSQEAAALFVQKLSLRAIPFYD